MKEIILRYICLPPGTANGLGGAESAHLHPSFSSRQCDQQNLRSFVRECHPGGLGLAEHDLVLGPSESVIPDTSFLS